MATENTGGWQLTTSTYARGGRMQEVGADGKVTATINNDGDQGGPRSTSRPCAGTDNSMGSTFDYAWGTINQAFAAGQIGMFTGGSDLYTAMVQNNSLKPDDYGVTTIPLDERPERRRPRRRHARRGQRRHHRGRARRGRQLDRLLLHAEAADPGGRRGRRQGAQGQQPAGRRARPADLRQGDLRPVAGRGSRTTSTSRRRR